MSPVPNPALPRYSKIPAHSHRQLPERPNLDHLKAQAKALLRDFLAGDAKAQRRMRRFMSDAERPRLRLKDAQYVIAREYACGGWKFQSWEDLKTHVDAVTHCNERTIIDQIDHLTKKAPPSRLNAHRFIGAITARAAPQILLAIRTHPDAEVRCNCISMYRPKGATDERFMQIAFEALNDRVPRVRRSAVQRLGWWYRESAVPLQPLQLRQLFTTALTDENAKVRDTARGAIKEILQAQPLSSASAGDLLDYFAQAGSPDLRDRAQSLLAAVTAS